MKNNKKYSFLNQSITRALDILESFSQENPEWTPSEIQGNPEVQKAYLGEDYEALIRGENAS